MCLINIFLLFTFCYVAEGFKIVEKQETQSIYTGSHQYFRHVLRGNKLEDSEPSKFERWFTQHLDHFNPSDQRIWQQRYYVNDELFNTTSRNVAFLQIGGEGEAFADQMTYGSWYHLYAKHFKPILFYLEHRYYGKSHPTEDESTENLVYLTSQQALADVASFIDAMNEKHKLPSDVKWIVFGGSYSGSLAAWMRLKYPHLVHGAVSSSAPLLAKLDFSEYLGVVQDALRANSEECVNAIAMGFDQIDTLRLHSTGQRNITGTFYSSLINGFTSAIQYNQIPVKTLCDIMTNESLGMEIDRLVAVNHLFLTNLRFFKDNTLWNYQTCTEFGFFQTSSHKPQIFGDKIKLDGSIKLCQNYFGPKFNKIFLENAVKRTNVFYGGLDIEVNNVVFVHGSLDPWHVLGITQSKNSVPAIVIEGASHCSDMASPSDNDTPQLKAARVQIEHIIGSWLDI